MSNSREPSPEGDHPSPARLDNPETHIEPESRRHIRTITQSHPQDFIGHALPVQNNDPILRYLPLYVVILSAVCMYIGMKSEAGCNFECMMQSIIDAFNTRGGNKRTSGMRRTRGIRNKRKPRITQHNTGNTSTSKNKQGSLSEVLPKELLDLKIGDSASITKIKDWIDKNKDNIEDEKLKILVTNLLESKEYNLENDEISRLSSLTVKQFIVKHKKQFLLVIRKLIKQMKNVE